MATLTPMQTWLKSMLITTSRLNRLIQGVTEINDAAPPVAASIAALATTFPAVDARLDAIETGGTPYFYFGSSSGTQGNGTGAIGSGSIPDMGGYPSAGGFTAGTETSFSSSVTVPVGGIYLVSLLVSGASPWAQRGDGYSLNCSIFNDTTRLARHSIEQGLGEVIFSVATGTIRLAAGAIIKTESLWSGGHNPDLPPIPPSTIPIIQSQRSTIEIDVVHYLTIVRVDP